MSKVLNAGVEFDRAFEVALSELQGVERDAYIAECAKLLREKIELLMNFEKLMPKDNWEIVKLSTISGGIGGTALAQGLPRWLAAVPLVLSALGFTGLLFEKIAANVLRGERRRLEGWALSLLSRADLDDESTRALAQAFSFTKAQVRNFQSEAQLQKMQGDFNKGISSYAQSR